LLLIGADEDLCRGFASRQFEPEVIRMGGLTLEEEESDVESVTLSFFFEFRHGMAIFGHMKPRDWGEERPSGGRFDGEVEGYFELH